MGQAWSQKPFTGQITGAVVTGAQTGEPLQGVSLRVETHGKLVAGGETDEAGRFAIDLPVLIPGWRAEDERPLAVNFVKAGYEQVIWVLDCHAAGQSACDGLDVVLTPLPDSRVLNPEVSMDRDEIDILDDHYRSSDLTLYFLPLNGPVAFGDEVGTLMHESFQDNDYEPFSNPAGRPPAKGYYPAAGCRTGDAQRPTGGSERRGENPTLRPLSQDPRHDQYGRPHPARCQRC